MQLLEGLRIARIATVPMFFSTHLRHQLTAIASAGATVTAISSSGAEQYDIPRADGLRTETIEISRSVSPLSDTFALWKLTRHFKRGGYDIVHSTTPKAGLLTAIAARIAGIPIRLHTFTGQQWVTQGWLMRLIGRVADALIVRLSTRCYADSPSQRRFLIDEGLANPDKIFVLGSGSVAGIDTGRFFPNRVTSDERSVRRAELGIATDAMVFLFLGRVNRDKGVQELISAYSFIQESAARLLIAGPVEDDQLGLMLQAAGADMLGFITRPEEIIPLADVLVLPSYREGFGSVVLEAAAMGVPAIGSAVYGLTDAIIDRTTGILVPPGDVQALAKAMMELSSNGALRRTLGNAASQRVEEQFSVSLLNALQIEEYEILSRVSI